MDQKPTKTLKTKNIKEAFEVYAQEMLLPLSECDFTLHKVDTYIRTNASKEFELYAKNSNKNALNKEYILNEHVYLHQLYTITLKQKRREDIELDYIIKFDKFATHPQLILSPNSLITKENYTPQELLKKLFIQLNKIKAYHGILINILDTQMKQALKILVKYIYAKRFTKKVKIPLFSGIEPIVAQESQLILWFEKKASRGKIIEVEENELLVEYKKPLYGQNGFNAYGETIDSGYATKKEDIKAEIDRESIRIEEDKYTKKYIAKRKGYVHYNEKVLAVDNQIRLKKLSRNRELLESDEQNNIEVIVAQNDTTKDSVGEGVELKSESINVEGFVGAHSVLEAVNLNIKGATHQDSKQYAKHAQVNRHKGQLRCHEAKVTLLEGGTINATKVHVKTALSGYIYAQDVTIEQVKNNLKVYASNSITIRLVSGEDNKFTINYQKVPIIESKLEYIEENIEELRYELSEAKKHSPQKIPLLQEKINNLKEEIINIKNSYKSAKISIEKPLRGLNHISFSIDSENELNYKTEARSYTPFYLEIEDNIITLHPVMLSITYTQQ